MKWLLPLLSCLFVACRAESNDPAAAGRTVAPGVLLLGKVAHPRITESSGLIASRRDPAVFWTHNDGGGRRQVLYAMTREGAPLAEYRVTGTVIDDWEDIAADEQGHLFLGDIGNNEGRPRTLAVHQVSEPDLKTSRVGAAPVIRSWSLRYPAAPFDCESLFIWGGHGYVISKVSNDARAGLFRFSLTNSAAPQTLEPMGEMRIDSPVTGADVSRDGNLLGIVAKNGAYVFRIGGDVARALHGKPYHNKFKADQIEAAAFVPEGLLTTAESREIYLFTDEAFRTGPGKKK